MSTDGEQTSQWAPQQEDALRAVDAWMADPTAPQVFRLQGYAGTGKTTISRDIYQRYSARACAFTGKAASVMAAKGLGNATTVHRLIYTPLSGAEAAEHAKALFQELEALERADDVGVLARHDLARMESLRESLREAEAEASRPRFILKEASEVEDCKVVILDEGSMVDERMGRDLLSFGTKVLVLGDPAQLPPVKGTGFFMGEGAAQWADTTTVTLTQIHRQAAGNPIIQLATDIREGRGLRLGDWGAAKVVDRISAEEALAADQILCGTNAKRRVINRRHRVLGGYEAHPMPRNGERLVCLRNNHELSLLNGTLWTSEEDCDDWEPGEEMVPLRLLSEGGGQRVAVPALAQLFLDEEQRISPWASGEQFTWGYCLTTHKSQGSQWPSVVVFDDWPNMATHKQWLYTSVTRAAERLVVVMS